MTLSSTFEQWANKVWRINNGTEVSLVDFRKNIRITVHNEAGQAVLSYLVYRCWVSEYQAASDLDANANAVLIEHIKLENEGWKRDDEQTVEEEPTFLEPEGP